MPQTRRHATLAHLLRIPHLVVAVNKWDAVDAYAKETLQRSIEQRLPFLKFAPVLNISAKKRQGFGPVWTAIADAHASSAVLLCLSAWSEPRPEQATAEHSSAVLFALRNKVDVTLEIAIGSSTQIALFVAPALVFISLAVGHPMDFVFSTFEVAAVALSTVLVFMISSDGRSNWLEGAQLMGAYVIMAVSFFFVEHL